MANITRYHPFHEGISLREAMNNLFEDSFIPRFGLTGRGMASNLYETAENFVFQMPMPGVIPENEEEATFMEEHAFCRTVSFGRAPQGSQCERCGNPAVFRLTALGGLAHNNSGVFCLDCGTTFVKLLAQTFEADAVDLSAGVLTF